MPALVDTIICENIRQEANNKLSLLGIFGDEVQVARLPYQFPALAVFQRWTLTPEEHRRGFLICRLELRPPQGNPIILPDNRMDLNPSAARTVQVAIQIGGLLIEGEGEFSVATFFDNVEANVHRTRIRVPSREEVAQLQLAGF